MNEVGITSGIKAVPIASSKGGVEVAVGKVLPQATGISDTPELEPMDVKQAATSMNNYFQSIQRDLEFSVDEELNQVVVKVIDTASGELIRQIPEETFLELARRLNHEGDVRLFDALG